MIAVPPIGTAGPCSATVEPAASAVPIIVVVVVVIGIPGCEEHATSMQAVIVSEYAWPAGTIGADARRRVKTYRRSRHPHRGAGDSAETRVAVHGGD